MNNLPRVIRNDDHHVTSEACTMSLCGAIPRWPCKSINAKRNFAHCVLPCDELPVSLFGAMMAKGGNYLGRALKHATSETFLAIRAGIWGIYKGRWRTSYRRCGFQQSDRDGSFTCRYPSFDCDADRAFMVSHNGRKRQTRGSGG